jgi:type VI secretion system protein VasI
LLKDMAGADKFIVQATPYDESPVTAVFDTTGMKVALAPLMDVCGWSIEPPTGAAKKPNVAAPADEM